MCHVSLPCSVGISELIKVCVLVINVLWAEMWGKETQAQEGLCWTAERVWGEDYSLPGLVSLFHPDDEDPLKGQTPHLWWWLRINKKHRQGGNASKSGVNNELLIGSIGCTNKDLSHSDRREMVSGDFEASLPWGFTAWELHLITDDTHTLTFALRSARKEIPEAHFQFMQNHHGKTDSFHFNWFSAVYGLTSLFNDFFEFAVFVHACVLVCVCS